MRLLFIIIFFCFSASFAFSQELKEDSSTVKSTQEVVKQDTTAAVSDSTTVTDSTKVKPKGDIAFTVNYKAKDSINFNLKTQNITMYKEAETDYGEIKLEADKIITNYNTKILDAQGLPDSTGKLVGKPIFTDKGQVYQTDEITYNFANKRATIRGVITQQGEAFMHSDFIKKNEKDELFGRRNLYTTCNLEHPHFGIRAKEIKLIPKDKILAGPFNLEINEIPSPLLFPFGLFPMPDERVSGILFPTYGEERRRGFFLRDGGYYWAINDYIDLALRGEIYTKGSYGLSLSSTYKKRYAYNGNISLRFNQQRLGDSELDSAVQRDFWVRWSHSPQSKGTGRFSASVNGGTSSFNQNNPVQNFQQQVNANFNSNISYSNVIAGTPFNYAISARHTQNVRTNEIEILLPEISLNMNRQYPLKNLNINNLDFLKKLNFSYNFNTKNSVTNNLGRDFTTDNTDSIAPFNTNTLPTLLQRAQNGGRHNIPISTSFSLFNYITASPNFSLEEFWYLRELDHNYSDSLQRVVVDTVNRFSRAASYNAGISFSSRLYGTVYMKKGKIEAIRHVATPTLSLNWRPDFSDPRYGIYQEVQTDSIGNTRLFSKFEGFTYGSPRAGRSGNISFSLANTIEMKVKKKSDTTETTQKVSIFDNLSISSSYNVLAESFRLAPIRLSARTSLFDRKVDINFQSTLDPYTYFETDEVLESDRARAVSGGYVLDQFAWENGQGIGRLTNANLAFSTNLNPSGKNNDDDRRDDLEDRARAAGASERQIDTMLDDPNMYVDFSVPWNLRIRYSVRWNRNGFNDPNITQSAQFSGDVNFTEKWKIGFNSGYDFEQKEFTQTTLTIFRDLHCWQINGNWTPFGRFESFSVDIGVKASILQDLKLNRRRNFRDNF